VIDAAHGVLRLVTSLGSSGANQAALFWGGTFKVAQSRHGNGLTRIVLRGAPLACPVRSAARASAASVRRRKVRALWGEDHHGRYSTYGANSVATVMGTKWETLETCAGTTTRVLVGAVRVRDLNRHKTVVVRAGHSYLAAR